MDGLARKLASKRVAWLITAFAVLTLPVVLYGAIKALGSTSNDPRQWLPRDFAATDTYDWFQAQFGSDEIAVVSWPDCTLDDPRVGQLSEALSKSPFFSRVRSGQSTLEELTEPPLELSRRSAISRLRQLLVGPDGNTTCLVLTTSPVGQADRPAAVNSIERLAASVTDIPPSDLKLAGPTVDAAMIDAESRKLLFQLAGLSALVSFVVASLRMGSIRLALAVLFVAIYSTGLSLAVLYYGGGNMNLLMTMLPPLVYVLTVSSAVHLANYYREAYADEDDTLPPALRAITQGWAPCCLAAATTGIGLVSLMLSKIEPIQKFGLYSAIGVVASVGVLFALLPSLLHLFPPRRKKVVDRSADPTERPTQADSPSPSLSRSIVSRIIRFHVPCALVCITLMALCAWRIPTIESTVKLQDRFLPSSDAIADYRWLEKNIGPMVPLEVVISFSGDDPRDRVDQLKVVANVQATIRSISNRVATVSAVNFAPPLPRGHSIRDIVRRNVINGDATRERWEQASYLNETDQATRWRISVRADAIGDLDYGLFAEQIRAGVTPLLESEDVEGIFTGVIPLIYKAQRQLLMDLFRSFIVAFFVIAAVLLAVLRNLPATVLVMIPNVFPAVVVFGGIAWADIPIQIGSVMTASAALGIAVDDTVHLLTWFRRGLAAGLPRRQAITDAFTRCAGAMVHTTLICGGGLIVFSLSTFVPILHFAYLMVFLLASALLGDLVLLPAILASPLGRCFKSSDGQ